MTRSSAVRAWGAALLAVAALGCARSAPAGPAASPLTVADVTATAARTAAAGTARLRYRRSGAGAGGASGSGVWDFNRRAGLFDGPDGSEVRVVNGAVFAEVPATARGTSQRPAFRWSPSMVPTELDVDPDEYFGLALEGPATVLDALRVLAAARSVDDLGAERLDGVATRHGRVQLAAQLGDGGPPEVWLDADGRLRRLRLAARAGPLDLAVVLDIDRLGTPAAVAVPAVDELDPSGEIVPLTAWRVTQVGAGGGRPWRLRTATDSRVQDRPTPTSGLCVALEEAPFPADEAPPSVYDCLPPGLLLARRVPQGLRGRVLVGTTGRPTPTLAITFDDGSTATLDATSGAFAVFTDGRKVRQPAELAG